MLESLVQVMMTLGRFASDLIFFTSQECDFFEVDDRLVTGSSIMPQKRNLDGLEILRANVRVIKAHQLLIKDLCSNLISGYHRDFQLIKKPLFESFQIVLQSVKVALLYLQGIRPKPQVIESKLSKGIFAADVAHQLVQEQGIAFRDAYQQALDHLDSAPIDLQQNLISKISLGAPGNLGLGMVKNRLKALRNKYCKLY